MQNWVGWGQSETYFTTYLHTKPTGWLSHSHYVSPPSISSQVLFYWVSDWVIILIQVDEKHLLKPSWSTGVVVSHSVLFCCWRGQNFSQVVISAVAQSDSQGTIYTAGPDWPSPPSPPSPYIERSVSASHWIALGIFLWCPLASQLCGVQYRQGWLAGRSQPDIQTAAEHNLQICAGRVSPVSVYSALAVHTIVHSLHCTTHHLHLPVCTTQSQIILILILIRSGWPALWYSWSTLCLFLLSCPPGTRDGRDERDRKH